MNEDSLLKPLQTYTNRPSKRKHLGLIKPDMLYKISMNFAAMLFIINVPQPNFILANKPYRQLTGNHDPIGKTGKETLPELGGSYELLDQVYTEKSFSGNAELHRNGIIEQVYC